MGIFRLKPPVEVIRPQPTSSVPAPHAIFVVDSVKVQSLARELAAKSNDSLRSYWRSYWKRKAAVLVLPPRIDASPSPNEEKGEPSTEDLMYSSIVADSTCQIQRDSALNAGTELKVALDYALAHPICEETFLDKVKDGLAKAGVCGLCGVAGYGLGIFSP